MENEPRQFTLFGDNLENIKASGKGSEILLKIDFVTDFIRKYINLAIRVFNDDSVDDLDKKINIERLMTLSDEIKDILTDYISSDSEVVMTYKSENMELNTSTPDRQTSRETYGNQPYKTLNDYIELVHSIDQIKEPLFLLKEKFSGHVKGELIRYCGGEDNIPTQYMNWNIESFSINGTKNYNSPLVEMLMSRPDTKEVK